MGVRNLYLVEDDADLRRLVARILVGLPDVRIIECDSAEDALGRLAETPPSIVISDLGLPGLSGIEFIARCRERFADVPVLVTTGNRSRFQQQLEQLTYVEIWEKPYPIQDLRERIHSILLAAQKRVFAPFDVVDYLQMASFAHHDLVLQVTLDDGRAASLEIVDGDIWSCHLGDVEGREALREVLVGETLKIDFSPLPERPAVRLIETPTQQILVEIAHLIDERRAGEAETQLASSAASTPGSGEGCVAAGSG
jgi:CheY-like chemotaxis protein